MSNHLVRNSNNHLNQFEKNKEKLQNEAYLIMDGCFEKDYVYKNEFHVLILLIILYRNRILNQKIIENIFVSANVNEDYLLDTIQILFDIHDCIIPTDINYVIARLSNYLPLESEKIQEMIKQNFAIKNEKQLNKTMQKVQELTKRGKYNSTLMLILTRLSHISSNPSYWYTAGLLYLKLKIPDRAEECFLSTLQLDPFYRDSWNELGKVYCCKNKLKLAKYCFKTALMVDFHNIKAWKNLLFIAYKQNNEDLVQFCLKKIISYSKPKICKK